MHTAAMTGATGAVGRQLLQQLLNHPAIKTVKVFGRASTGIRHDKLQETLVELDQLDSLASAQEAIDLGFCCLGTTRKKAGSFSRFQQIDRDFVANFARFCQRQQCQNFSVVSAVGASSLSMSGYLRTKGDMELQLRKLNFEQLNIVRPALLYGDRPEHRPMEELGYQVMKVTSPLMLGPLARMKPVSFEQVAATLIKAALSGNKGHRVIHNEQVLQATAGA